MKYPKIVFSTALLFSLATPVFGQPVDGAEVAPRPAIDAPSVLEFRGSIDGSERIEVTASGAMRHNVDRHLPKSPMRVNGTSWNPRAQQFLDNGGESQFLDDSVDFSQARLEVIAARDTVAMTKSPEGIMLHLNDTPNGAAEYHFRVHFTPPRAASLRITARIDGSDVLYISRTEARWEHKHWKRPANVTINGRDWNPRRRSHLPNAGKSRFLPTSVDFSTARLVHKDGRDMAVVTSAPDGVTIHFADNPNGADDYELIVAFGR